MPQSYLIPTRADIPPRLQDKEKSYREEYPELRLGIYCAQESHRNEPWLIGSFRPSWEILEQTGELAMTFTGEYVAGDRTVFQLANASTHMISDGQRTRTDQQGNAVMMTESERQGHGRVPLDCKACGLRRVYRIENVQAAVKGFMSAGIREIDLSTFNDAVNRTLSSR